MYSTQIELENSLKNAFQLAKEKLIDADWNGSIAEIITNDTPRYQIPWENLTDKLFEEVLNEQFHNCIVRPQLGHIDLCVVCNGRITIAIECKGMFTDTRKKDLNGGPLGVWGIRRKLYQNKSGSVKGDIDKISDKIPANMEYPRFEVFIPVVYEIYRKNPTHEELFRQSKPWTTHPKYKDQRKTLRTELAHWFQSNYPDKFELLYSAESVELSDANRIWRERHQDRPPCTPITKAHVSFFAFGRFVEGRRR